MAIIMKVDQHDFANQFEAYGRLNSYSKTGMKALYDHLNDLSEDAGINVEMDVIAICCDYNELSVDEVIGDYLLEIDLSDCETLDETNDAKLEAVREYLNENTLVADEYELEDGTNFLFRVF